MKLKTILLLVVGSIMTSTAQVNYGTPTNEPLPAKIQGLERMIEVINFPKENDPIKIKDTYYWKHLTSILCKEGPIKIIEYGAFLFYNGQWNLRKSYPLKELDKNFGTSKQQMLQGQPYTWANNWRKDERLFGGWAMWYFIGEMSNGQKVCGYETIHTTSNLLTLKN